MPDSVIRRLRQWTTAFTAGMLKRSPFSSSQIGPPKGLIWDFRGWAEAIDRKLPFMEKGWRHWSIPVREAEVIQSRPPLSLESEMPEPYREAQLYRYPPLYLAHVRLGRLALREGVVISTDDRVFDEFSYCWGRAPRQLPIFHRLHLPPLKRKAGVYATILSPGSAAPNYFHWLVETLPRIAILEEAGIDNYLLIVPRGMAPWQTESLERLGFSQDRLAEFGEEHWQVDSLLVPSLLGYSGMCRPWAATWLRRRLGVPERKKGTRRLYVSRARAGHRRVSNEEEVLEVLTPLGFESVSMEGATLEEQISLFSEAAYIVGLHGAGLTNALFAPSGTCVIEFMSPVPRYLNACYYSLSSAVGHRYMYLLGTHRARLDALPAGPKRWREDLEVPTNTLSKAVHVLQAS